MKHIKSIRIQDTFIRHVELQNFTALEFIHSENNPILDCSSFYSSPEVGDIIITGECQQEITTKKEINTTTENAVISSKPTDPTINTESTSIISTTFEKSSVISTKYTRKTSSTALSTIKRTSTTPLSPTQDIKTSPTSTTTEGKISLKTSQQSTPMLMSTPTIDIVSTESQVEISTTVGIIMNITENIS